MWQKLSASLILYFFAVVDPLPAFAQQTQPSSFPPPAQDYYWYGPLALWMDDSNDDAIHGHHFRCRLFSRT